METIRFPSFAFKVFSENLLCIYGLYSMTAVIHEDVKDRCPQCKGEKVVQEKKVLEVVEKGITFPGEADEAPDIAPGDIVFIVQQKEHPKFKRTGDDLFV